MDSSQVFQFSLNNENGETVQYTSEASTNKPSKIRIAASQRAEQRSFNPNRFEFDNMDHEVNINDVVNHKPNW
jgi:hypothetical protein